MSLRAVICGNLGMHNFGAFRHFNRFEQLHAFVRRNRFTISDQTSEVGINSIAHHFASFSNRLAPGVTPWKRGDGCMVSPFVWFENYAVGMGHAAIITSNE